MNELSVQFIVLGYCGLTGFVAAGLLGSFYQLITSRPPQFQVEISGVLSGMSAFGLILLAGPFILMRNALRGRRIEQRPVGWLVASSMIAMMWSVVSGLLVLQLALNIV